MCGIFGIVNTKEGISAGAVPSVLTSLFKLSETRGKEASGLAVRTGQTIKVLKSPNSARELVRSQPYQDILSELKNSAAQDAVIIGHSRLVTNGSQHEHRNNQPVVKNGYVAVHNGIVVNVDSLWAGLENVSRECEVDSEVIPALVGAYRHRGEDVLPAINSTLEDLEGMSSFCLLDEKHNYAALATNNGSLYYVKTQGLFIFGSERYILQKLLEEEPVLGPVDEIHHLKPNTSLLVDTRSADIIKDEVTPSDTYDINVLPPIGTSPHAPSVPEKPSGWKLRYVKEFERSQSEIDNLQRCTDCLLPETIPYIKFDDAGICSFCKGYRQIELQGQQVLEDLVAKYRSKDGSPDCLVAFSGGRDSSYGLHYIKTELGMNPIAYTYDWGMITDLARRNQSRMCGALGIEHILVSADIPWKRSNIRKNVDAWLQRPELGTVPLFMAGDKQFFYHAHEVAKQNNIELIIFSENLLEKTHFKYGFCGVAPDFQRSNTYTLSLSNKARMALFYAKNFLLNPRYFNSSILDTVSAFRSYYVMPHEISWLFQYIPWNEEVVDDVLINQYNWETAEDTNSTWRIGDGTASFYNYIYYKLAGFTENDTFRSNQIREGALSRSEALAKTREENQPRWQSIEWYCDTIGIPVTEALDKINATAPIYRR